MKKIIIIAIAVFILGIILYFLQPSEHYTYANIDNDEDRIIQKNYQKFIIQNESLYLPVIKAKALPLWGYSRTHYLWSPLKVEELINENPRLKSIIHSDWSRRYDGESIFK